jgi:hypothetical protein
MGGSLVDERAEPGDEQILQGPAHVLAVDLTGRELEGVEHPDGVAWRARGMLVEPLDQGGQAVLSVFKQLFGE